MKKFEVLLKEATLDQGELSALYSDGWRIVGFTECHVTGEQYPRATYLFEREVQ